MGIPITQDLEINESNMEQWTKLAPSPPLSLNCFSDLRPQVNHRYTGLDDTFTFLSLLGLLHSPIYWLRSPSFTCGFKEHQQELMERPSSKVSNLRRKSSRNGNSHDFTAILLSVLSIMSSRHSSVSYVRSFELWPPNFSLGVTHENQLKKGIVVSRFRPCRDTEVKCCCCMNRKSTQKEKLRSWPQGNQCETRSITLTQRGHSLMTQRRLHQEPGVLWSKVAPEPKPTSANPRACEFSPWQRR
ncbi:hypothetical protein RRG08_025616 [Elysia crispata]|uniref:Uncharacterized protein n=1 Tax=Elysia crispata TaxID=231223 RepID=A0AAE0YFV5_9GAST|nr:hypothetical protein RRG08_025616 [Elysia crispata]